MDEKNLRAIIEQVLAEMNVSADVDKVAKACTNTEQAQVESGCLPDITAIDIRKQYLVKNPEHGEEYAELKAAAPCRLGIGKAGARYNTLPQLEFRAAHWMLCSAMWIWTSWRARGCSPYRPSVIPRIPI